MLELNLVFFHIIEIDTGHRLYHACLFVNPNQNETTVTVRNGRDITLEFPFLFILIEDHFSFEINSVRLLLTQFDPVARGL